MIDLNVVVTPQLGSIDTNFELLKKAIAADVKELETAEFSEAFKTLAKKEVANLRGMKKTIDTRRIEAKKQYMEPYNLFEAKCNELKEIIDKPIVNITAQIEEHEKKRIQERQQVIDVIYQEAIGEVAAYLPLTSIQSGKWLNVSTSIKSIREEIENVAERVASDLAVINSNPSEAKEAALEVYKKSLKLSDAIQHINSYEVQKSEILKRQEAQRIAEEERRIEREQQRIRAEERRRVAEETKIVQATRKEVAREITAPISDEIVKDAKVTAVYTVSADEEELSQIEMFFDSIGVTFSRKSL